MTTLSKLPTPTTEIVLCRNSNLLIWTARWDSYTGASTEELRMAKDFDDLTSESYLYLQIMKQTHYHGSILDSNNQACVHRYQCCTTIFSDHYIVEGHTTNSSTRHEENYFNPLAMETQLHSCQPWNITEL